MRQACRTCMAQSKGLLEKQTRIHSRPQEGWFPVQPQSVVLVYPGSSVTSWVLLKFGFEFFCCCCFFVFCFFFLLLGFFFFFHPANMYEVGPGPSALPRWRQRINIFSGLSTKFEANAKSLDTRSRPGKSQ